MANILFLTSHLPFPPLSGGRRREYELLRRLGKKHNIEICAVTRTMRYDQAHLQSVQMFAKVNLFESPLNTYESPSMCDVSFLVQRNTSHEATKFINSRLAIGDIDLVHCEGFYMYPLLKGASIPVFVLEQNIEYLVWPQAENCIRNEEIRVWRSSTRCGAVTEEDAAVMSKILDSQKVFVSFNGCDHQSILDSDEYHSTKVLPSGSIILCPSNYAYHPSYEAGYKMCTVIAPRILKQVPDVKVLLVGNEAERLIPFITHPNIIVHGRVPSLEPYYDLATVVACPLSLGRGIKVKILESLKRGCVVVTTTVGQQGLKNAPLVIANSLESFVSQIVRLLLDQNALLQLRQQAIAYASTLPTWDIAAQRLHDCWEETICAAADIYFNDSSTIEGVPHEVRNGSRTPITTPTTKGNYGYRGGYRA